MVAIHTMLTITDAASETINRLDMINPFLRLVNKLSLRKARRADYAKTIMGGQFIIGLISAFLLKEPPSLSWSHRATASAPNRRPGDVNDGKGRIDLSGLLRNLPAVHPALQIQIGHQRSIFAQAAFEKCDRLFAGCCDGGFEPAFGKRIFENVGIVFNDQNHPAALALKYPFEPRPARNPVPKKCSK